MQGEDLQRQEWPGGRQVLGEAGPRGWPRRGLVCMGTIQGTAIVEKDSSDPSPHWQRAHVEMRHKVCSWKCCRDHWLRSSLLKSDPNQSLIIDCSHGRVATTEEQLDLAWHTSGRKRTHSYCNFDLHQLLAPDP